FLLIEEDREDHAYALRLQREFDSEQAGNGSEPIQNNRRESFLGTRPESFRVRRRRDGARDDTSNDEAIARELQESLDAEESNAPNIRSIDVSSLFEEDTSFFEDPYLPLSTQQQHFEESNHDENNFPGYPIYIGNSTEDYYENESSGAAIKGFNETDFVLKPRVAFRDEPALDAGGVFNDTIRQILEIFMSLENPEYGGDGHLFTGESSKLISSTAPVHFVDELDAFGDVLYLAVIHNIPFPSDLDIALFKYSLSLENTISVEDLRGFSTTMYNLARNIYEAQPNVKLSTIEGFDQWAEEKEINARRLQLSRDSSVQKELYSRSRGNLRKLSRLICEDVLINSRINQLKAINKKFNKFGFFDVLKSKRIDIADIKNYFYREIINPNDIIQKLVFDDNLNHRQNRVRTYLIDWLRMQEKSKLQEFCRLVTGFKNPREQIKVSFKPHLQGEPREINITPKFATCFQEIKLSENFSSRQEFYTIMNAQIEAIHDNRFTTA
ncbi:13946_t:CDS:10, partial [Acaulospora colombiana]